MKRLVALLVLTAVPGWSATPCADISFDGKSYTVCEVDPANTPLRLFLKDAEDRNYGQFAAIERDLNAGGKRLGFAMNGGMYHQDRAPVGHYVENGQEVQRLITSDGPGNFGLLPNGVLCLNDKTARVYETLQYRDNAPGCRHATQSGPMLVIDGKLHPRFLRGSTSRFVRNGVGTTNTGDRAVFAISNDRVTFHEFGRFFRDHLGLPQALYFDGAVSRIHAPNLGRSDTGFPLGPIIGTVEPAD